MTRFSHGFCTGALLLLGGIANAQPPGITMEQINTTLPLEGAPLAEPGPHEVVSGTAHDAPGLILFRPADPAAAGKLPLLVWGNGGCAIDGSRYGEFLATIASHGFLTMTTLAVEGEEPRQQNAGDLLGAIAWAEAENARAGSPLHDAIDLGHIAVMGQSCGGFLSIALGADPRVDTIGVFNSGVTPAAGGNSPFPSTAALEDLHGPVMFINGHDRDFMQENSHNNFELVEHVPAFYGARHDAGHTATVFHPGGGEFANVASNWLLYQFRDDAEAARMFVGDDCELCVDPNWETDAKGLD